MKCLECATQLVRASDNFPIPRTFKPAPGIKIYNCGPPFKGRQGCGRMWLVEGEEVVGLFKLLKGSFVQEAMKIAQTNDPEIIVHMISDLLPDVAVQDIRFSVDRTKKPAVPKSPKPEPRPDRPDMPPLF